ncbi:UDP-N-acetylmuramate dehydrogenase [Candidatus Uhrbacteria bacterium]|nr:UDP-N-acetylmuramate dehydrogenase [Candidatus Uhrbacteria bacterium]
MIDIRENVPLAPLTTLDVGGPARFFVSVTDQNELLEAVGFAKEKGVPIFILVGGSNVVVSDSGFPGLVIKMEMKGIETYFDGDDILVRAGAGESWDGLVGYCVAQGLSGLECLSGIPGSVGAAPVQNIGAYGVSVGPFVDRLEVFDRNDNKIRTLPGHACEFSYRDSMFKHSSGASLIITNVTFRLKRSLLGAVLRYHDLQARFGDQAEAPIVDIRKAILEIRAGKGMVILQGYEAHKSAGSFFKNPVVAPEQFTYIEKALMDHPDGVCAPPWFWIQNDGQVKVAAACLLEASGFHKGYREGSVGISPKHALAIINYGGARASDIVALAEKIQQRALRKFGVRLEPEAQYIGFDLASH